MTEEQKDILIAKMLDVPSSLSDKELEAILHEEELRDIYEMSAAVSGAYVDHPDFDIADEWNRFSPKIRRKPMGMRWAMQVAAIFLGVLFAGGIVVGIISNGLEEPRPAIAKVQDVGKSVEIKSIEEDKKSDDMEKNDDSPSGLEYTTAPSRQYASNTKTIETEQMEIAEEDVDIDEYLRIQQARIDHDLSVMAAESYMYEYKELIQDFSDTEAYDAKYLESGIRQVTMQ